MGKYFKRFNCLSQYENYMSDENVALPNVSWIVDDNDVKYTNVNKNIITCIYSVTQTNTPIQICNSASSFETCYIDGELTTNVPASYTFKNTGEHTIVFHLEDSIIPNNCFSGCTALTSGTTSGTNVKMTTSGKQNSDTAISNYQLVEFTDIDGGEHRITVMYRKDSSAASGTDRGYVLIPKEK